MSLASSTLADAGGPGTREDEDGVYGAVAVCRYALHRMPNKHKLKLVDPSGSGGGGVGGAPADGPTTDEDLDGVTGNGNGDEAGSEGGPAAGPLAKKKPLKAGARLRVAQAGWCETVEVLEARALTCVVDASVRLHDGSAAAISGGGFGLREEAERVLEEALQEFGHRLSPFQTARVWRALARNKAASDPKGCVAAFTKAKTLATAHAAAAPAQISVHAAHLVSSASVVAAALAASRASGSGLSSDSRLSGEGGLAAAVESAAALTDGSMDASDWLDGGKLSSDDHVALAAATASLGDFTASIKECRAALSQQPGRADLYVHLAGALCRMVGAGSWPAASSTHLDADAGGARHLGGDFLRCRLGKVGAAAAIQFTDALKEKSAGGSFGLGGGATNLFLGEEFKAADHASDVEAWREATAAYEEAVGLDARAMSSAAYYFLGLGRLRLGDATGALPAFQAAARLDPHSVDALLQVALVLDRFADDKARAGHDASGRRHASEQALKAFQRAGQAMLSQAADFAAGNVSASGAMATLAPFSPPRHEAPAQARARLAREAAEAEGGLVEVQLRVGQLAGEVGDKDAAVEAFGRVLMLDEGHAEAKQRLADLHGDVAMTLYWAGAAAIRHGDFAAAEKALREAVALAPAWAEARAALATALNRRGKHLEALALSAATGLEGIHAAAAGAAGAGGAVASPEAAAKAAHDVATGYFKKGDIIEAFAHAEQALEDNRLAPSGAQSVRALTVELAIKVASELADTGASVAKTGRCLRLAATHTFKLAFDREDPSVTDALAKINALAGSWVERGMVPAAAAAYEAVLCADHEAHGAVGPRGPRCSAAVEALEGLRAAAAGVGGDGPDGPASAKALALRADEFASLPGSSELAGPCEEARQQAGRGDFEGAVRTYRGLLRLKGNLVAALEGLVAVSGHLRRQRRLDQAADVCKLIRAAAPDFAPGAAELALVHCATGDLELFRAGASGNKDGALKAFNEAIAVAAEGCPEEGCVEALYKLALATGAETPAAAKLFDAAASLPVGKASVHVDRATALLKVDKPEDRTAGAAAQGLSDADASALPAAARARLLTQVKAELGRAVRVKPSSPATAYLALAEACAATADPQGAATHLASALKRTDGVATPGLAAHAQALLGVALEQSGETAGAVEATEAAATLDPGYSGLGARLRHIRVSHGAALMAAAAADKAGAVPKLEQAVATLTSAASSDPLAAYRDKEAEAEKRAANARGATAASPSSAAPQVLPYDVAVHEALARAHLALGKAYASGKDDDAARASLEQFKMAVEHDGSSSEARAALAAVCRAAGQKLVKARDLEGAVRFLQDATRAEPLNGVGHTALGRLLEEQGLLGQASAAYKQSLRVDPKAKEAAAALTKLEAQLKDKIADLQVEATLATSGASSDPEVALHLGEALEANGDLAGAAGAYQLSLQVHPDYAPALARLASALLATHDADEASAHAAKAGSPNLEAELALRFQADGGRPPNLSGAVQYFRRAAVFLAESAEVQSAAGLACVRLQRSVDACAAARARERGMAGFTGAGGPTQADLVAAYVASGGQTPLDRELAWREAAETLRLACVLSPGYAAAFVGLAEAKEALGDGDGALSLLVHASRLDPTSPSALARLGLRRMASAAASADTRKEQLMLAAEALTNAAKMGAGGGSGAVDELRAFGLTPLGVNQALSRCFLALGTHALAAAEASTDKKAADEVVGLFDSALEADPTNAVAHFAKGSALKRLKNDLDGAEDAYTAAQAAFGPDPYPEVTAGLASVAYARAGGAEAKSPSHAEEALKGFKQAIREGYTGTAFRVEMAEVLAGQKRLQDAAVAYRSLVDEGVQPGEDGVGGLAAAWTGLASVRVLQKRFSDAAGCHAKVRRHRCDHK